MITWSGVSAQLKNDETFVLPSAEVNLNVEKGSNATFPRLRASKTNESRNTPQTETADPCGGCISHLNFNRRRLL